MHKNRLEKVFFGKLLNYCTKETWIDKRSYGRSSPDDERDELSLRYSSGLARFSRRLAAKNALKPCPSIAAYPKIWTNAEKIKDNQ